MAKERYPITGCRADSWFGLWLCTDGTLETWVDTVWAVVDRGELKIFQDKSAEMEDQREAEPLYKVDRNGIVKLTMSGPMTKYSTSFQSLFGGVSMTHMREVLREIRMDNRVAGVFIDADSNGGTAEGVPELAHAIRTTAKVKPLVIHAEDKANSGMLWVASQAPIFTCGSSATVGSQGTMAMLYDSSGQENRRGKPIVIKTGEFKGLGTPGMPITDKDKQELQRMVDLVNEPFRNEVNHSRRLTPEQLTEVRTARVFVGKDAVRAGLCDRVCSTDEAYDHLLQCVQNPTKIFATAAANLKVSQSAAFEEIVMPMEFSKVRDTIGAASTASDEDVLAQVKAGHTASQTVVSQKTEIETLKQQVTQSTTAKTTLEAKVGELQQQLAANPTAPKIDQSILEGNYTVAEGRLQNAINAGKCTDPQAKMIREQVLKPSGQISPLLAASPYTGTIDAVFKMLEMNQQLDGFRITGGQPQPRQEPGSGVDLGQIGMQQAQDWQKAEQARRGQSQGQTA